VPISFSLTIAIEVSIKVIRVTIRLMTPGI
jgi:hypothetical protein